MATSRNASRRVHYDYVSKPCLVKDRNKLFCFAYMNRPTKAGSPASLYYNSVCSLAAKLLHGSHAVVCRNDSMII